MDISKKKEKFYILENEDLAYIINRNKGDFKIRLSKSEIWTDSAKGKQVARLTDDEDTKITIKVNDHDGKKEITLQYDTFKEVLQLMLCKAVYDEKKYLKNIAG